MTMRDDSRPMLSRRRLLGTALAAGTAMAVPATAQAAAGTARGAAGKTRRVATAPQTLAASGRPAAGAQRTSFRIGYLGLNGPATATAAATAAVTATVAPSGSGGRAVGTNGSSCRPAIHQTAVGAARSYRLVERSSTS